MSHSRGREVVMVASCIDGTQTVRIDRACIQSYRLLDTVVLNNNQPRQQFHLRYVPIVHPYLCGNLEITLTRVLTRSKSTI